MADARSVALIVHGVGDHTHSNILDALDLGLQRSLPSGTFESDRLTLSKVFLPSGTLGNVEVTRIKTSKRESFVIPVVWSREHLRAEPQIKYHIFRIGSWIFGSVASDLGDEGCATPLRTLSQRILLCL